ncbi:MAG TPA: hypothetical protein VGS41_19215, partial [Chthonomonadales bacterium]|nr:hypothetical protein [Chthonomonadales bacterium]
MRQSRQFAVEKPDTAGTELLKLVGRILDAIHSGDVDTYAALSLPDLSCFEDVCPYRIDGLAFHLDLIKQMAADPAQRPRRYDILSP